MPGGPGDPPYGTPRALLPPLPCEIGASYTWLFHAVAASTVAIVKKRGRIWIAVILVVAAAVAAWPSYRWWVDRRTSQFEDECRTALKAEDWTSLEESSRRWLAWDDENGDAWLYLATAAQEQGDEELAVDCLDRLPDDHPKCVVALLQRVDLLMKQDRVLEAEESAERAVGIKPHAGRAHKFLIYIAAMTLERGKLFARIRESIKRGCEPPDAYAYLFTSTALRLQSGYTLNSRWLRKYPDSERLTVARAYFQSRGRVESVFGSNGEEPERDSLMRKCRDAYPNNVEVLAFYLDRAVEAGDRSAVARLLSGAPSSAEHNSRIWAAKGWYLNAGAKVSQAEEAYREAVEQNRYDWRARHQLAAVLRRLDKTKEADAQAKLALLGKQIERRVLESPTTDAIARELLPLMRIYAEASGDDQVARAILRRLYPNQMRGL